jgi:CcmD family protein
MMISPAVVRAVQEGSSMREFWHVFVAYAVAWVLIFGWIVSILRRLAKVEERIGG